MKRIIYFILLFIPACVAGQLNYDDYFTKNSFRFDCIFAGNANETTVYPGVMKQEAFWAGSLTNQTDQYSLGEFRFRITDTKSNALIFSKGFSTLFQEWQSTPEAQESERAFYQCLIFPYPKRIFRLEIEQRDSEGQFYSIFQIDIDPDDPVIRREAAVKYEVHVLAEHGKTEEMVDVVFLAEGYTQKEMDKFLKDANRFTGFLFSEEPFKSKRNKFNIRAVLSASDESGTDIPGDGVYKNTTFNSSFHTFGMERYLTSEDLGSIHDAAANAPYDHIYVLVNSNRYGGGGIYNFLNICTTDNEYSREVFLHEFGHGFAGLGDEYYSSAVEFENFYNTRLEPWESNLTTLVSFSSKWKSLVHDSVPVPTPREGKYSKTVGVFEGGGYQAKGIYSPYMNCRMKSNTAPSFCPVCIAAIKRMIDYHCD